MSTEPAALALGAVAVVVLGSLVAAVLATVRAIQAQRRVEGSGGVDGLTGLPDRTALAAALGERLSNGGRPFTVALLILDRFARVNDTYGHDVGDHLLAAVGRRLEGAVAGNEQLYRVGGPAFAVVAPDAHDEAAARALAGRLQEAVHVQYRIQHDRLRVSATIGVVVAGADGRTPHEVLDHASAAVRHAVAEGLGNVAVHDESMGSSLAAIDPQAQLERALEQGELRLAYLPVVQLADGGVVGAEALLRWAHPELGTIGARDVISMLAQTDLAVAVGDWVVTEACRQNLRWQQDHPDRDLVTTINIAPSQLGDPEFMAVALRAVSVSGADPSRLCFEITEGALRADVETTWRSLRQAKDAGVQLALDDFGVGYSTFDWLRHFDLDVLKIARVFVDRVTRSNADYAMAQQLVGLAHSLDFVTIAEGVDREQVADALRTMGCDLAQGFYWGRPLTPEAMTDLVAAGRVRPVAATGRPS